MTTQNSLSTLITLLEKGPLTDKKVFVGFDGFVDSIQRAVKVKSDSVTLYYDNIDEFIDRVRDVRGKSGQIELKTEHVKIGGNAPIYANALGRLGVHTFCVGSCGSPEVLPLFKSVDSNCDLFSVLNPGVSQALEFNEGKLILSDLEVFDHYNWSHVKAHFDLARIREAVLKSSLCAFLDWVNLPHSSDLWKGVLDDIIKPSGRKDYCFLFDLCDPSKKTDAQIDNVLDLISSFSQYGEVILGLNENETLKVYAAINGHGRAEPVTDVLEAADFIYKSMNIQYLLVHTLDRTILYHQREHFEMEGKLVARPKVLTGGGDNLNAGFTLGMLAGLPAPQSMLLGMAASGSYIENGVSPSTSDLVVYLKAWRSSLPKMQSAKS